MPTQTKPKQKKAPAAVFLSNFREQQVIVVQGWDDMTPHGRVRHQPKIAEFREFKFVVDEGAAARMGMSVDELLAGMEGHMQNRDHPHCQDAAFWKVAPEVFAPAPEETLTEIAQLAARQDLDGLSQLLEEEREGYNREKVILACEGVLEALTRA